MVGRVGKTKSSARRPARLPAAPRPPRPEPAHRGRGAALVMDDEECVRCVASFMLQRMGYTALTASDGREALAILKKRPCRLVLLDVMVPGGMGGVETVREIRKRHAAAPPVLAMSGNPHSQALTDPRAFGFNASIAKPFTMSELAGILNQVARRHPDLSP